MLNPPTSGEDNQDLWLFTADFCSKWHLRVSDQSELLELVRDYGDYVPFRVVRHDTQYSAEKGLATSQPKFQVIHLHDLPPEIVSHIMSFADTSALWRLRMTARYFRDISRRYLYKVRPVVPSSRAHQRIYLTHRRGPSRLAHISVLSRTTIARLKALSHANSRVVSKK